MHLGQCGAVCLSCELQRPLTFQLVYLLRHRQFGLKLNLNNDVSSTLGWKWLKGLLSLKCSCDLSVIYQSGWIYCIVWSQASGGGAVAQYLYLFSHSRIQANFSFRGFYMLVQVRWLLLFCTGRTKMRKINISTGPIYGPVVLLVAMKLLAAHLLMDELNFTPLRLRRVFWWDFTASDPDLIACIPPAMASAKNLSPGRYTWRKIHTFPSCSL